MKSVSIIFIVSIIIAAAGCSSAEPDGNNSASQNVTRATPEPEPTKFVLPAEYLDASPEELCARLAEVTILPYRDSNSTDPIYDAMVAKGNDAIPCLIEKISDTTKMSDPREAPKWQNYAVGDTAVFILLRILTEDKTEKWERMFLDMLPPKYREEWKTNGVYAYFNYVSESNNRKELQRWWQKWAKDNIARQ